MSDLRKKIIRLAHRKPHLRKHLVSILKSAGEGHWQYTHQVSDGMGVEDVKSSRTKNLGVLSMFTTDRGWEELYLTIDGGIIELVAVSDDGEEHTHTWEARGVGSVSELLNVPNLRTLKAVSRVAQTEDPAGILSMSLEKSAVRILTSHWDKFSEVLIKFIGPELENAYIIDNYRKMKYRLGRDTHKYADVKITIPGIDSNKMDREQHEEFEEVVEEAVQEFEENWPVEVADWGLERNYLLFTLIYLG